MSRSERLFDLLQVLRRQRGPVSGQALAGELGVSIRTLYRDIASLQAQGAHIEGEAGVGYVLRPGFMLPPLMFSHDEIEALVLGSRWAAKKADHRLADAATDALAKIAAVLPSDLRDDLEATALLVGPRDSAKAEAMDLTPIRKAIRSEHKLMIHYRNEWGTSTNRIIWPFALGFFDQARIIVGWCEVREGFRHFRTDRILDFEVISDRYPRRRAVLLKEWRVTQSIQPLP